ncbi:MAG: hypothetical protein ACR2HR_01730 [Euzebya sp.]
MGAVTDRASIDKILHDQPEALKGYDVHTVDGHAGKLADGQDRVDEEHVVVHIGGKLFGSDVVMETEAIKAVDTAEHVVEVDRITDWVKSSPKLKNFEQH